MNARPLQSEVLCLVCSTPVPTRRTGRPSRYCSTACRQRAYRARRKDVTKLEAGGHPPAEPAVPHLSRPELLAWRGLLELQSRMMLLLDEDLQREAGLTVSEFDLLYQLWVAPGQRLRMKHLAAAVLVTPSGVTRMVNRLEERGLVRRINSRGRQAVETCLTETGSSRLQEAMDSHFREVRRLFVDNLSASDITRLAELWQRLSRTLPKPGGE